MGVQAIKVRTAIVDALIVTPDLRETCQRDAEWSYNVADALDLLGEKKEALDWLDNAVNRGFINYPFIVEKFTLGWYIEQGRRAESCELRCSYAVSREPRVKVHDLLSEFNMLIIFASVILINMLTMRAYMSKQNTSIDYAKGL
jgi:hypothetical protein